MLEPLVHDLITFSTYHAGNLSIAPSAGAANVTYYIQAERVLHDFAPGGLVDLCTGLPLDGETSVRATPPPFIVFAVSAGP